MRYRSFAILLLGALAACDSDPVAPEPPNSFRNPEVPTAQVNLAIEDVLTRILPSLEGQPAAAGLRTALTLTPVDGVAVERLLSRLETDPANGPDVTAIRLAIK